MRNTLYIFLVYKKVEFVVFHYKHVILIFLNDCVTVNFIIYRQIVIQSKDESTNKYYFVHGPIKKNDSRVTVVTRDGTPQSGKYTMSIRSLKKQRSMKYLHPLHVYTL